MKRRGSALIELALSSTVLVGLLVGAFQFGYSYYAYDRLESAVHSGARYASRRPYTVRTKACEEKMLASIRNLVVYGDQAAAEGSRPALNGLRPEHVEVDYKTDARGVPSEVRVSVRNYGFEAGFSRFELNGKPWAVAPYLGRYAPNECE